MRMYIVTDIENYPKKHENGEIMPVKMLLDGVEAFCLPLKFELEYEIKEVEFLPPPKELEL